ncbi:hypothetical protein HKX48_000786 [Thoreauomyces humboldtii]|nr:hypothetical protein HKX48_000786 [Thoreauomyces humboldtii]
MSFIPRICTGGQRAGSCRIAHRTCSRFLQPDACRRAASSQPPERAPPIPSNPIPTLNTSSAFPLPSLFNAGASASAELGDYPWLLSTSPPRRSKPSLWTVLRDKYFLAIGTARARKHLQHPTYDFPTQFCTDASVIAQNLFALLSDPQRASDSEVLRKRMVKALADRFAAAQRSVTEKGQCVTFHVRGIPKVTVTGTHFTYGPYPVPAGYVCQKWWSLIELVVPEEDQVFTSHVRQKEVMQRAMDDGVIFKIDVRVDVDLDFVLTEADTGKVLLRDTRRKMDLQFITPHFTPEDEVVELGDGGERALAWQWRVSDVDWIVESLISTVNRTDQIDWQPKN